MSDFSLILVLHLITSKYNHQWRLVGGRVHLPLHPDQRLHLNLPGDCRALQPQRWQGTHLRRHVGRLRMGQAAKVLHGREHRVPAADGTHTQLLQVPYGQAGHKSLRTEENKPHQSIRVQVLCKQSGIAERISVPAKWIRTARHYLLNIYTDNKSYQNPFALADG